MGVSCVLFLLLMYTVVVIPLELSYDPYNPCSTFPTFHASMAVDVCFLIEIAYRFFVGVYIDGQYHDNIHIIARMYATSPGGLWFDLITSIPFTWIQWSFVALHGCGTSSQWPARVTLLRLLKPVRMAKILRLLKTVSLFATVRQLLHGRVSQGTLRCTRLFLLVVVAIHYFACGFWMIKWSQSEETFARWLENYGLDLSSRFDVYVLFFYFVSTTMTTVGYGDVAGSTSRERMFVVALQMAAVVAVGTIVSQMQQVRTVRFS